MAVLSRIKTLVASADPAGSPRVAVFGDSHTAALIRAQQYSKRSDRYRAVAVRRYRKRKEGTVVGDVTLRAFCREVAAYERSDFVFSALGGNQYAIVSTVRSPVEFDVLVSPSDEMFSDEAAIVPARAIASFIESGIRESVASVLKEIRRSTRARLYHLVPPPPKKDNDFIVAHSEGYFGKEGLRDIGPTHPELRLKCWKIQLQVLERACGELQIPLIMPPSQTVTPDGYLDPAYYAEDVTHANRRYGEAVLRQIQKVTRHVSRR